uniref:Uncharacterized protein n=1 Tax=Lactuca sativa TaxID=4236 RepID=A0A9R1VZG6_LACSA|nr:hypothetical protein LSAT_V11C400169360 [Lactuca sativa]
MIKDILKTNEIKLMRRYNIPHFKEDNCGCQLRRTCGLPCAHKITIYSCMNQPIPLSSIYKCWRNFDLINVKVTNDANFRFEEGVELLKESYVEQPNKRKHSYVRKLWDIFSPSTTTVVDPGTIFFNILICIIKC